MQKIILKIKKLNSCSFLIRNRSLKAFLLLVFLNQCGNPKDVVSFTGDVLFIDGLSKIVHKSRDLAMKSIGIKKEPKPEFWDPELSSYLNELLSLAKEKAGLN
jgi:hypothetical protein